MNSKTNVILLVEDDMRLASLTREYLESEGYTVKLEQRGDKAVDKICSLIPDLVILDLMLPGKDGLEICRDVRPKYHGPIIMLTARDQDIDEIVGLEIGADDYITKPVQPRMLLARIRASLRRVTSNVSELPEISDLEFGKLIISDRSRQVLFEDVEVILTTNEYELLLLLAKEAGHVVSRDKVLQMMRGIGYDGMDRSVDINISRLRKKLGDDTSNPKRIKTVRGKGYLFVADTWS